MTDGCQVAVRGFGGSQVGGRGSGVRGGSYFGSVGSAPFGTDHGCSSTARRPTLTMGSASARCLRFLHARNPVDDDAAPVAVDHEGAGNDQLAFLRLAVHVAQVRLLQLLGRGFVLSAVRAASKEAEVDLLERSELGPLAEPAFRRHERQRLHREDAGLHRRIGALELQRLFRRVGLHEDDALDLAAIGERTGGREGAARTLLV